MHMVLFKWKPPKFSLIIPTLTLHGQLRVVVFHSFIRPAWIGKHILLAAEELDHRFTGAVIDRDHVECTTLFLTAVESQLSERQVWPKLFRCTHCDTHFVVVEVSVYIISVMWSNERFCIVVEAQFYTKVNKSAVNCDSGNLFQSILRFWALTTRFAKDSRSC